VKVGGNPPVEPEPSSPAKSENVATAEVFRSTLAQGSPMNPMTVTRVPEHLLPMSPVRTPAGGEGELTTGSPLCYDTTISTVLSSE
jgi:hypothetical protein